MTGRIERFADDYLPVDVIARKICKCERFVRDAMKRGEFGKVYVIGGTYLVALAGFNAFLDRHELKLLSDMERRAGFFARSEGELRRKVLANGHPAEVNAS